MAVVSDVMGLSKLWCHVWSALLLSPTIAPPPYFVYICVNVIPFSIYFDYSFCVVRNINWLSEVPIKFFCEKRPELALLFKTLKSALIFSLWQLSTIRALSVIYYLLYNLLPRKVVELEWIFFQNFDIFGNVLSHEATVATQSSRLFFLFFEWSWIPRNG